MDDGTGRKGSGGNTETRKYKVNDLKAWKKSRRQTQTVVKNSKNVHVCVKAHFIHKEGTMHRNEKKSKRNNIAYLFHLHNSAKNC